MLTNMSVVDHRSALAGDLRIAVMRLARRLRTERADHGLTLGQISMLATLDRHGAMTAGELAAQFEQSWPTMSGHFAVLRDADLIQADRVGSSITYRLNVSVLEEALTALLDAFRVGPGRGEETGAAR